MSEQAVYQTELSGLTLLNRGKVRDLYEVGDDLLIVAPIASAPLIRCCPRRFP